MYIAPGQRQTAPRTQNFDVNRNVLSLHSFAASFKTISVKSDFIQIFHDFIHVYSPKARADNPFGDEIFMSTGTSCHFGHMLQVSKKSI